MIAVFEFKNTKNQKQNGKRHSINNNKNSICGKKVINGSSVHRVVTASETI